MVNASIAMTTTNTEREAKELAALLVKERLAACVQIIPKIFSVYEWKNAICNEQEYLLLIKTQTKLIPDVKKLIAREHSYEVPEFLAVPVEDGLEEYLKWMKAVTK